MRPDGAREAAPAKVNLFLHVGPPADDGYHPIASLMVFADIGDVVTLRPAPRMAFNISGPFSGALDGAADNLVVGARDRLLARVSQSIAPFALELEKNLPVAAGLGGGSADAAASLRLMARALRLENQPLAEIAGSLGADVPACLHSRAVIAAGRGDVFAAAPGLPRLDLVVANPGVGSSTAEVYRAYDRSVRTADLPRTPARFTDVAMVRAFLAGLRNDLETPAISLQPRIGEVLQALRSQAEALLARMSGSGASCFALCASAADAARLADRLARREPGWWVRHAIVEANP